MDGFLICSVSEMKKKSKLILPTFHLKTQDSKKFTHPINRRITFFLVLLMLICCFRNKVVEINMHFDRALAPRMRNVSIIGPLPHLSQYPRILNQETLQFLLHILPIYSQRERLRYHFFTLLDSRFCHVTQRISRK